MEPCDSCNSTGILWLRDPKTRQQWVERCGECKNYDRHFGVNTDVRTRTRAAAEAEGLEVWPKKQVNEAWTPSGETVEQMAERIGERVPF
ncbi:MAG: hypothetical protein JRJ54_13700 [Deltaproteobacteria bacterium]|nr:hypothetical protein [Deltaproteobacteria bacterium]